MTALCHYKDCRFPQVIGTGRCALHQNGYKQGEGDPPPLEHYIRECAWCDETYICNVVHREDLRPAYALCTHCSWEFQRQLQVAQGDLSTAPLEYDPPIYWPSPASDRIG